MVGRQWLSFGSAVLLAATVGCDSILGIGDHEYVKDASAGPMAAESSASPMCPPGCFSGTPTTDLQFFNQCTTATCVPYDNCQELNLCPDGGDASLPPLVPPDAATATSDASPPSLPTVPCYDPTARPLLIFMQGSTNFTPFIEAMAPLVAPQGYVIVWQPTSSCAGAAAGGFDPTKSLMMNPTSSAQTPASFYDGDGGATPCLLGNSPSDPNGPDGGVETTDIGESDVFANICPGSSATSPWVPGSTAYPSVSEARGPVQAMVFVTPQGSTATAISAEAAYEVFGTGGNGGVSKPWTNPADIFIRSSTTGTTNILSLAIDVPPTQWWGTVEPNAPAMVKQIVDTSVPLAPMTIGTLSTDYADTNTTQKRSTPILYFQAKGQLAGFLPDSTPGSFDKQNVRDGHYSPWGYIHLYSKLNSSGVLSPQASALIQQFNMPNTDLLNATINGAAVPTCAMHVQRTEEMGPLTTYNTKYPCNCFYDLTVNGGTTQCATCKLPADCQSSQVCNYGYCEDVSPEAN
ncbi:MAG: hypothetical protein ABSC94_00530 [Polyangiaceae bacterium]|jgi:hypothetical protein